MMLLSDDVLSYIFSFLKPQINYFLINKRIYNLRKEYLTIHLKIYLNIKTSSFRENYISCLLHYHGNNLNHDIGHYRKHILHFIANKNKKTTIYSCKNSYHRMLVHRFCETQGLIHETIEKNTKKRRICKKCKSTNILISSDGYYDYYFSCKDCDYRLRCYADAEYFALDKLVDNIPLPLKVIKITKKM